MGRSGLVLIVLMSATVASAEGDSYWAVAVTFELTDKKLGRTRDDTYGAAWNFPSREEAEKAAIEACHKRTPSGWKRGRLPKAGCEMTRYGKNSCFYIVRLDTDSRFIGKYTEFPVSHKSYPSRAEAEAAAKLEADFYDSESYPDSKGAIEMVECSGAQ